MSLILLASALSGCSKPAPQPGMPSPTPTAAVEPSPTPDSAPSAKIATEAVDVQGTLNGRIDENSVEIAINPEDTLAFRVTDVLDQLKDIKDGDKVKFSYSPNPNGNGQLNITKIEKIK